MSSTRAGGGVGRAGQRPFALIGDPVAHSPSPAMYEAAFRTLGLRARYSLARVPAARPEAVGPTMRRLSAAGGGGNVTLPHKRAAARALDWSSPTVIRTGACNCFWLDDRDRLAGDNTDVAGFLSAVQELAVTSLEGADILLLGAGGAARAVLVAAAMAGASRVDVLGRSARRVRILIDEAGNGCGRAAEESEARDRPYALVVNATPLGLSPMDPLPLRLEGLRVEAVLDLVYGPDGTAWTRHAESLGLPAMDGLSMLVHQAALSVRRWYPGAEDVAGLVSLLRESAWRSLRRGEP